MRWTLATLALLALGLVLKLSLLVYAMYVLLGLLLLNRFLARTWIDQIAASRSCERTVAEIGETASVRVGIRNASRFAIPWLILEDTLPRDALVRSRIESEGVRAQLARLDPGDAIALEYRVAFRQRGYYQIGPLMIETGDVFGLHRRYRVTADPEYVTVPPKVLPLQGYNLASRRPIGEVRLVHRLFEDPTRIAGVREYRPGDPLNRIHWRASARTGHWQSRVFEPSCVAGVTILLDFHLESYRGHGAEASAELGVTTVASLANAVDLQGQQIGFASNGRDGADRIREEGWQAEFGARRAARQRAAEQVRSDRLRPVTVPTRKGTEQLSRILHTLGRLEHTDGLPFHALVTEVAGGLPRDATVVAVLREVTEATAIALGELVRQGYAVIAVVLVWDTTAAPDWAQPPDWAGLLLDAGVDFRIVSDEDGLMNLCAEAILRT
jgi:uncharacterized protein (DUF58 family)